MLGQVVQPELRAHEPHVHDRVEHGAIDCLLPSLSAYDGICAGGGGEGGSYGGGGEG